MLSLPRPTNRTWVALLLCLASCGAHRSLRVENDLGDLQHDYNHGTEIAWTSRASEASGLAQKWLDTGLVDLLSVPDNETSRMGVRWRIGQLLMVPVDIALEIPNPRDRPYAGWLYAGLAAERLNLDANDLRRMDSRSSVELNLGIVGPSSLNEQVQTDWHKLAGLTEPNGWGSQLKDEATVMLTAQRDRRILYNEFESGHAWDLTGHVDGRLGNLHTEVALGGALRFGKHLARDFPMRTQASGAGGGSLFAFGEMRGVAHDMFLDGNTWRHVSDGPSVEKETLVGDIGLGLEFNIKALHMRLAHVWRSEEFESQDGSRAVWILELGL